MARNLAQWRRMVAKEERAHLALQRAVRAGHAELAKTYPKAARALAALGHTTVAVGRNAPGWSSHLGPLTQRARLH